MTSERPREIDQAVLWVWEDGEAVSMAAAVSPTPHGVRVNFVYSPPERRGRLVFDDDEVHPQPP